jgi:hypothetical protein
VLSWGVINRQHPRQAPQHRHLTKIPSPQLLYFQHLQNRDACNSFRFRSYENCRVSIGFSCFFSPEMFHISFAFKSLRTLLHNFAFSCTHQKLNSFVSKQFRTLYPKTRGIPRTPLGAGCISGESTNYLLMSSFASSRFSNGWRKGFVASGALLMACVISLAAVGKSPVFDEIRANARWLTQ